MFNKSRLKYGNKKVSHAGHSFGSKLEASTYDILKLMEKAGAIKDIKTQQSVYLTLARIQYIADFSAVDRATDEVVYYEAKGVQTPVWAIKKRLWKTYGPGVLYIFTGSHLRPVMSEEIHPVVTTFRCKKCGATGSVTD